MKTPRLALALDILLAIALLGLGAAMVAGGSLFYGYGDQPGDGTDYEVLKIILIGVGFIAVGSVRPLKTKRRFLIALSALVAITLFGVGLSGQPDYFFTLVIELVVAYPLYLLRRRLAHA